MAPLPYPTLSDTLCAERLHGVTAPEIRSRVEALGPKNWFITIARDGPDHYIQTAYGPELTRQGFRFSSEQPPMFVLEIRDGGPDRHFATELDDRHQLTEYLIAYCSFDESWREQLRWYQVPFE